MVPSEVTWTVSVLLPSAQPASASAARRAARALTAPPTPSENGSDRARGRAGVARRRRRDRDTDGDTGDDDRADGGPEPPFLVDRLVLARLGPRRVVVSAGAGEVAGVTAAGGGAVTTRRCGGGAAGVTGSGLAVAGFGAGAGGGAALARSLSRRASMPLRRDVSDRREVRLVCVDRFVGVPELIVAERDLVKDRRILRQRVGLLKFAERTVVVGRLEQLLPPREVLARLLILGVSAKPPRERRQQDDDDRNSHRPIMPVLG